MTDSNKSIIETELYQHVLEEIFGGFVRMEPKLLQSIETFSGEVFVDKKALIFTLPALFEFSCASFEQINGYKIPNDRSNYLCFRKALYSNPTNCLLRKNSAQIELETNHSDINKSQYKLVFIAPSQSLRCN